MKNENEKWKMKMKNEKWKRKFKNKKWLMRIDLRRLNKQKFIIIYE
jgi:chromatin remodeling complex protein RSC6